MQTTYPAAARNRVVINGSRRPHFNPNRRAAASVHHPPPIIPTIPATVGTAVINACSPSGTPCTLSKYRGSHVTTNSHPIVINSCVIEFPHRLTLVNTARHGNGGASTEAAGSSEPINARSAAFTPGCSPGVFRQNTATIRATKIPAAPYNNKTVCHRPSNRPIK